MNKECTHPVRRPLLLNEEKAGVWCAACSARLVNGEWVDNKVRDFVVKPSGAFAARTSK